MLSILFFVVHWTIAILFTWRLMAKKKPVGESLAWLFVIYAMPFLGPLVYYAFGERRQGDKRTARLKSLSGHLSSWQDDLEALSPRPERLNIELEARLAGFVKGSTGYPVVLASNWCLLDTFDSVLQEMLALIDGAKEYLHLEFYIWEPPGRIQEVQAALLRARKRGVTVRILVDSIGSDSFLKSQEIEALRDAGCEVEISMKVRLFGGRWDLRNHRKILVADGLKGLVGSMNMGDPEVFKADAGVGKWIDAMVRIEGAGAQSLNGVFLQDWWVEREGFGEESKRWDLPPQPEPISEENSLAMQVLPSGPGVFPEAIHQVLMIAIYGATEEILISTPYFVPGEAILNAIISASMRGVRVTLIIPKKSDFRVACLAGAYNYYELLDAGVEIGQFKGGLLHTKSITIDGRASIFGTVNLDMRSFWLNSEVTLMVYDKPFTQELRTLQLRYWEHCEPITLERWSQRSRWRRALESAARLFGPVL